MKQKSNLIGLLVITIFLITGCGETPAPTAAGKAPVEGKHTSTAMPDVERGDNDPIYRVRVDHRRGRYWVLGDDYVQVYNVSDKRLIAKVTIPGWNVAGSVGLPDLVLDRSGAAFISSNVAPTLWHIDPDHFSVTRKDIALQNRENWSVGFSGLTFDDDATLLGVTAFAGTLWKIDVHTAKAVLIELSEPLLDAHELWVIHPRVLPSTLRDTVLCVSTGMAFYEVKVAVSANTALVQRSSIACAKSP